jgi:hypothetical protein
MMRLAVSSAALRAMSGCTGIGVGGEHDAGMAQHVLHDRRQRLNRGLRRLRVLSDREAGNDQGGDGSACHQPSQAFSPTPSRVAAEVAARNAVSAESTIRVRLPMARPVTRLATASPGMTSSAAAAIASPAVEARGRAPVTRSAMPSMVR